MSRTSDISTPRPRAVPCAKLALVLIAFAASVGCGEDVLVARFGLTSNAPDAGLLEEAAGDAGLVNGQSVSAQRARARARRAERLDDHAERPGENDKKH